MLLYFLVCVLYHLLNTFFKDYSEDIEIIANITSGTKPMALALFNFSIPYTKSKIWYFDQNNNLIDVRDSKSINIENYIPITKILSNRNIIVNSSLNYDEIDETDLKATKKSRNIFDAFPKEFLELTSNCEKNTHLTTWFSKNNNELRWDKFNKEYSFNLFNKNKKDQFILTSKNIHKILKNNGWFEFEIAELLKKWKGTHELILNTIFPYSNGEAKNEVDIIVRNNNKLLFVECKLQVNDIKDLDKFKNAVKNYGGLSAKALLITDQPLKARFREKCEDNNIIHFNLTDSKKSYFGIDKALFLILENEFFKTNTK